MLPTSSPPGYPIDLMSRALRVNALLSIRRFSVRHTSPDLSQSPSTKALGHWVVSIPIDPRSFFFRLASLSPALCSVTLEGSLPYASSFLPALCRAQVGLLANHSLGAHDHLRCTLDASLRCSISSKACRRKNNFSFLPR